MSRHLGISVFDAGTNLIDRHGAGDTWGIRIAVFDAGTNLIDRHLMKNKDPLSAFVFDAGTNLIDRHLDPPSRTPILLSFRRRY